MKGGGTHSLFFPADSTSHSEVIINREDENTQKILPLLYEPPIKKKVLKDNLSATFTEFYSKWRLWTDVAQVGYFKH